MRVEGQYFIKLYDMVLEKFIKEEYGIPPTEKNINSGNVWMLRDKNEEGDFGGEPIAIRKFRFIGGNHLYLFIRWQRLQGNEGSKESVNNVTLIKCLEYIGFSFTKKIEKLNKVKASEKASIIAESLWDDFKSKMNNLGNSSTTESLNEKSELNISTQVPDDYKLVTKPSEIIEFRICSQLYDNFFNFLANREFTLAWKLLSQDFRENSLWENDFYKFCRSFEALRIVGPAFAKQSLGSDITYKKLDFTYRHRDVSFDTAFSLEYDLYYLRMFTVLSKELGKDVVCKRINRHFEEKGYFGNDKKEFEDLNYAVLINPDFQRYLWTENLLRQSDLHKSITSKVHTIQKLVRCHASFVFYFDHWEIDKISFLAPCHLGKNFYPNEKTTFFDPVIKSTAKSLEEQAISKVLRIMDERNTEMFASYIENLVDSDLNIDLILSILNHKRKKFLK